MLSNIILIYDWETSSIDPETCHVLQLSALAIDASHRDLPIMDGGVFDVFMKPNIPDEDIMNPDIIKEDALKKNGIKREDILKAPSEKHSWNKFVQFCNFYSKDKYLIPAGHNIVNYDNIITERLRKKYKSKQLFHNIAHIDLLQEMFLWLENVPECKSLSLDYLRDYMGLKHNDKYGASHNSLRDCYDCYEIIKRIIQWRRQLIYKKEQDGSRVCRFKDCFS